MCSVLLAFISLASVGQGRRVQYDSQGAHSLAQVSSEFSPLNAASTRSLTSSLTRGASVVAAAGGMAGVRKTTDAQFKVCVVGGAGGIGQPLSLAVASHALVKELSIVDLNISAVPVDGVAADLAHVEGPTKITSTALNLGEDKAIDKAGDALSGCNVVLVPAGMPRKPGQDRKDLMNVNADIAKGTLEACAKYCPDAVVGLIVNPVNSIVPAMAELYKKAGLDPLKIVGITTLDCVRSNKFVQEILGEPADVTVVGGHAGKTILPLLSQDVVASKIPAADIPALDERIQNAGTEVVQAKAGRGSATLSMAFAAARFLDAVLEGLSGKPTTECAYVQSSVVPSLPYFASKVVFGKNGVEKVLPIGDISDHEKARLDELIPILKEEIDMGLEYAEANEFAK
mmetsp:Transcript_102615/g.162110  ORF Transcript_102615/g.162110 Transcript_102615/m.162110 type:complete len:400 (-) Transcript_102615:166-1365(-)